MGITKPPADSVGFTVVVVPKALHIPCWKFIVLLGKEDSANANKLVPEICQLILEPGDHFSVFNFEMDDEEGLDGVGVVSYYEDAPDTFDWVTVPRHMRN